MGSPQPHSAFTASSRAPEGAVGREGRIPSCLLQISTEWNQEVLQQPPVVTWLQEGRIRMRHPLRECSPWEQSPSIPKAAQRLGSPGVSPGVGDSSWAQHSWLGTSLGLLQGCPAPLCGQKPPSRGRVPNDTPGTRRAGTGSRVLTCGDRTAHSPGIHR